MTYMGQSFDLRPLAWMTQLPLGYILVLYSGLYQLLHVAMYPGCRFEFRGAENSPALRGESSSFDEHIYILKHLAADLLYILTRTERQMMWLGLTKLPRRTYLDDGRNNIISTAESPRAVAFTVLAFTSTISLYIRQPPSSGHYDFQSLWISWGMLFAFCLVRQKAILNDAQWRYDSVRMEPMLQVRSRISRYSEVAMPVMAVVAVTTGTAWGTKTWLPGIVVLSHLISLFFFGNQENTTRLSKGADECCSRQRRRPSTWSLICLCYSVMISAFVALLLYRASDGIESRPKALLTGTSMAGIHVMLAHVAKSGRFYNSVGSSDSWDFATRLTSLSFAMTTIFAVFTSSDESLGAIILLGALRACQWSSVYWLITSGLSIVASTSQLAALGAAEAFLHGDFSTHGTPFTIFISAVAIYLTTLPKAYRIPTWAKILLMLLPLWPVSISTTTQSFGVTSLHPVEALHLTARRRYEAMVSRQSKTVEEAVAEYHRRYHRTPPKGFDEWAQLALDAGLVFIDEFDGMTEAFEPFRKVDPEVLEELVKQMVSLDIDDIVIVTIENGEVNSTNDKFWAYHGDVLRDGLTSNSSYTAIIPNITILLNTYDEPKVIVHPVHEQPLLDDASHLKLADYSRTQPWSRMTASCHEKPTLKKADNMMGLDTIGFISNLTESQDVCQHLEYQKLHSFFNTPESLRLTDLPLPLFSQARPSSFQDLLYPSPFYEVHRSDYEADDDLAWDSKYIGLYWRGSTTGGHSTIENWPDMHRQRMVLSTQATTEPHNITLLRQGSPRGSWKPYTAASTPQLQDMFDTSISEVLQCDTEACDELKSRLPAEAGMHPASSSYEYKYVLDMDGNGFSGRYYRILRSRSAVIKQTLFKEWHDDWLVPWYHFIPLSIQGTEVWELMRFLDTDKGDMIGASIARSSSDWTEKHIRHVDIELVTLRLMLEYGALFER